MDLHQLKTFVAVARERSITRASELLHLSQPAVSAHIKAIEDGLGLALFERTSRGMVLTFEGERLLVKAEETLAAHRALMSEAQRLKGRPSGKLRLGANGSADTVMIGRLLATLSDRNPEIEVVLRHGTSAEILAGIRNGSLDAGFYNESGEPDAELSTLEVARFTIHVAVAPGAVVPTGAVDWRALAELPWIYPAASACCGRTAERLFESHGFRPQRVISVDREDVTRSLVAAGLGVGLLHADHAHAASERGEVALLFEAQPAVRVMFASLRRRADEPLLRTVIAMLREPAGA
ncbi:MAG: LysR family transcriptional regulator [Nannocystaceae bacterium]|nr:LysR family transcriptional regulator [Nannocystaceae bacterium]